MRPSISVCIATYNGEKYLSQQLDSIILQLQENDEIIISDDGSIDNTKKIAQSFRDRRIKIFDNDGPHGYTSNFQNALNHCTNEIIFLSDQDDIWLENKVTTCLEYLRNYDFIVHDAITVDTELKVISESFFRTRKICKTLLGNILKFSFLGCCMAFRKKVLATALPFPSDNKLATHDNWLFLISSAFFTYKIVQEPLILYRRHGNNTSTGGNKKKLNLSFMIRYRIYLIHNLLKRKKLR